MIRSSSLYWDWAWVYICGCLPLTILIMCLLSYRVRTHHVLVVYYRNLLVSNLIISSCMIVHLAKFDSLLVVIIYHIYIIAVMTGLCFRACIALERCCSITIPDWKFRQSKASLLLCVCVWIISTITVPLIIQIAVRFLSSPALLILSVLSLLPGPVFVGCLAGAIRALPGATLIPAEEKRRTLAMLILQLLQYILMFCPIIILFLLRQISFFQYPIYLTEFVVSLFLLCPFVDLILFVFMLKGPVDKLLASLCCRKMDNTVEEDVKSTDV